VDSRIFVAVLLVLPLLVGTTAAGTTPSDYASTLDPYLTAFNSNDLTSHSPSFGARNGGGGIGGERRREHHGASRQEI